MKPRPKDFRLRYHWTEGTVPPPDYYEYMIVIGYRYPWGDEIMFRPDYPGPDTPQWIESLTVSDDHLDGLYTAMAQGGAFAPDWARDEDELTDDSPVGGSQEWMHCRAWGMVFRVPHPTLDPQAAQEILATVRALVPGPMWARLMAKQQGYAEGYAHTDGQQQS